MQPLHDLRCQAGKHTSNINITHAAAAPSAAITISSAETGLQNTKELRTTASEIAAPKPDDFEALWKRNSKRKIISAKIEKIVGKSLSQP